MENLNSQNSQKSQNKSSVEFQKKLLESINDDDYLATMERKDRVKSLVKALNMNPGLISNIKALMDYRDLRTKQAWLPNFIEELNSDPEASYLEIDRLRETVQKLDRDRRSYHNKALGNFYGMVNYMRDRGMKYYYRGKLMDPGKESNKYCDPNIRQEMTDFFLNSLYEIEEMNLADLQTEYGEQFPQGVESLKKIRGDLAKSSRDYGVKTPIREDDGDIEFYS